MADPKYAGLPGIVYDQPDVYETNELPESEQEFSDLEIGDLSPAVEVLHISGNEAHERFKGKSLDPSQVDFSDRISRRNRTGYLARGIEWDIVGEGEEESVVQKYQRLQCEINHLQQEVLQLKGDVEHGGGKVSAVELGKKVDSLHSTLLNLNLEETLGKDILSSISEPEVALQRKLVNLLENFKTTGLVAEKKGSIIEATKSDGTKDREAITYELYYAPEHAKLNQLARASQLEKRLDNLEKLIGSNPDKMSSLSTWTNHKSLLGAVQVLSSRLSLLEPAHLDHVEGRLHSVHTRMNSLSEKKAAIEDADKQSKVSELYDMMKKCEVLCSALPEVVDRLISVENLHQEASQFSRSLKQLDVAQTQLNGVLQANSSLLTTVQEKFMENLNTIQKNMTSLDERIKKFAIQSK